MFRKVSWTNNLAKLKYGLIPVKIKLNFRLGVNGIWGQRHKSDFRFDFLIFTAYKYLLLSFTQSRARQSHQRRRIEVNQSSLRYVTNCSLKKEKTPKPLCNLSKFVKQVFVTGGIPVGTYGASPKNKATRFFFHFHVVR